MREKGLTEELKEKLKKEPTLNYNLALVLDHLLLTALNLDHSLLLPAYLKPHKEGQPDLNRGIVKQRCFSNIQASFC